ncbi:DUF177 domain-containing protein [Auritidibacter sp. NML100628]|uniref:YceD family protein n=1 Tax=Auritidibacter sp. NML100628 TaxID=2170742 RepID=UPI000D72D6FE|nr:DUF177 domain-containing protein [Auritidibacter sp. NML100628]PXA76140.1 metal-binding protein [Auritidibacter sp. NML100628]
MANPEKNSVAGAFVPSDSAWVLNVKNLNGVAGSSEPVQRQVVAPEGMETPIARVEPGSVIELDLRMDSLHEGILVSGDVNAELRGECSRCLDPLSQDLNVSISELYQYVPDPELDPEEQRLIVNDAIDIELPVIDAVLSAFPFKPVCKPDCQGLCDQCGVRLDEVDEDHHHEQLDPRWAALAALSSAEQTDADATIDNQTQTQEPEER